MNAARILAAAGPDGGFKDTDACVAKAILQSPTRNARQIETLRKLLIKYPEHLQKVGVTLESLDKVKVPEIAPLPPAPAPKKERVRLRPVDTKYGAMVAIEFPYHPKIIKIVKELKNRQFDAEGKIGGVAKTWLIPARSEDVKIAFELLQKGQTTYPVEMDLFIKDVLDKGEQSYAESRSESADLDVPTKLPLRSYQKAGVKWIDDHNGRSLIADEPGVGKSCQALGWLVLRPEKAIPALVLCPATLRINWTRETQKFTDFKTIVISGVTSIAAFKKLKINVADRPIPGHDITIINYDLLSVETAETWVKMLLKGELEARTYAHQELVKAGRQALGLLKEKMEKIPEIESRNRLSKVYAEIEGLGKEARSLRDSKHTRTYVNGIPVEEFLAAGTFKTLVADEIHYCKETSAQRTQATMTISESMENAIGLTGTPILNRTKDLWSQTQVINKTLFPSFFSYGKEFCAGHQKQAGHRLVWDFSGSSNLGKLEKLLRSSMMIRRTKEQVLKELPAKTRVMIPFVLDNKEEKRFQKESEAPLERLAKLKREREEWKALMDAMNADERKAYIAKHAETASRAGRLSNMIIDNIEEVKQAAMKAKMDQAIKFVLNMQEQNGKILVFASHHETIDKVSEALRKEGLKVGTIDSRIDGPMRTPVVDAFQSGDTDALVCGIRAASEGLTLTASHTVICLELDWNPGRHVQAEDRVHRFGQTMAVTVYYLVVMGTIEEKIAKMIDAKRELINAAMGEGERTLSEDGILDSVLDSIFEEEK